eukprot:gene17450-9054_t
MEFEEEQRLTDEDVGTEEELIDLVKACPILYDVRLKVYKDRNMKDSAWRSISEAMKLSVKEETVTGKKIKKRYKYADKMKFLERCIQHRTPPGNMSSRSRRESMPQHNSVSMVLNYSGDGAVDFEQEEEVQDSSSSVNNSAADVTSPNKQPPETIKQEGISKDDNTGKYGKRRRTDNEKHPDLQQHTGCVSEQDDSKLFCLSLISTLKRLDSQKRQLAKLKIQNILYDIEFSEASGT